MIRTEAELTVSQEGVANLERVLVEARRTHSAAQYTLLSKPILLELQERQAEIVEFLMTTEIPEGATR